MPSMAPGAAVPPASLQTFRRLFDAIGDMVSVIGEDLVYRLANEAWCRSTGIPRERVEGQHTESVFADGSLSNGRRQAFRECLDEDRAVHVRDQRALPNGQVREFESTYHPFGRDESGQRCVVVVTRDITEQATQQRALVEAGELLRLTLHATGEAIFASDAEHPDQPLRFVNQQTASMWNLDAAEVDALTLRRMLERVAPMFADPPRELARVAEIIDKGLSCEDRIALRDGRVLLRRCVTRRAPGREHAVRVWSFRDITLEVRAEQAWRDHQAETTALLDAFPGYIAVLDEQLRYTFVNARFAQLVGRSAEELIGLSVEEFLGPARGAEVRQLAARALADSPVVYERETRGRVISVTLAGTIDRRIGKPRYYGFGVDVTEARRAERAMRESAQALLEARDEAERANRAKSQFLSHMSHELRTPLNAILGFAQLLDADGASAPAQQRQVAEILRGGRHLLDLINDMLDLGRIEAGRLAVARLPLVLRPLLEECLRLMTPLAAERGVRLLPPAAGAFEQPVVGDAMRLKQVLLNLIGNAIKYNQPGGQVALEAETVESRLRLVVRDDGIGLTPEQQERLFKPFERLHGDAGAVEGTGIGLALSRHLMQAMGGQIGASSTPGRGSRFWIELPLHLQAHSLADLADVVGAPSPASPLPPEAAVPRQVLYIEDNPVNVVLMEAMLSRLPGVVMSSELLPRSGIERARALRPDLILLDIQLPGMSGFEVLRELRADAATQHIPVVAVSANAMQTDVAAGLAAGFFDYVTKPLEPQRLVKVVQSAFAAARPLAETPAPR